MSTKICSQCHKARPYKDFNCDRRSPDGLQYSCRDCARISKQGVREKDVRVAAKGMKICGCCKIEKSLDYFYSNNNSQDGYMKRCIPCTTRKQRTDHLFIKYGITRDTYNAILKSQEGVCKICKMPETIKSNGKLNPLSVDHDHKTHKVRGLLCRKCNSGLGHFNDDPELLIKAANYLEKT